MTIHHVDNEYLINLTYAEWFKDYLKTGKYSNYIVNSTDGVVELHKLNDSTNRFEFNQLVDDHVGKQFISREPVRFKIEPLSGIYTDDKLMNRKYPLTYQGRRKRYFWKIIPIAKAIKHKIVTSTASKRLGNFIFWVLVSVVAGVIVLTIWAVFQSSILSLFN